MTSTPKFATVDKYIASFPDPTQRHLKQIRSLAREIVPGDATETISYGIPTFKIGGTYVVYFAGYKNHVSVYPLPGGTEAFRKKLEPYRHGAGTARFSVSEPLPEALIKQMIRALVKASKARTAR